MTDNLIISDSEFIFAEKILTVYVTTLSEICTQYIDIVNSVSTHALEDDVITTKLSSLMQEMSEINSKITNISELITSSGVNFIEKIDEEDQFLY